MLSNSIALIIGASYFGVEAYRTNGRVGRIVLSVLSALFVLTGLFLAPLTGAFPKVGAFITGIFDDPSSWFILLIGLFFVLRPFWQPKPGLGKPRSGAVDLDQIQREYELLGPLVKRLEILESNSPDALDALEQKTIVANATYAGEIAGLKAGLEKLDEKYTAHHSLNADALRAQFDNVYMALAAVGNRERLNHLADKIDKLGDTLSAPTTDPEFKMDEAAWKTWVQDEEKWRGKLNRWCELAEPYKKGVTQEVLSTPEGLYRSNDWTISDNQCPPTGTSNSVHAYKSFRIILSNWKNEWGNVNWRMMRAAFQGQAARILRGEE